MDSEFQPNTIITEDRCNTLANLNGMYVQSRKSWKRVPRIASLSNSSVTKDCPKTKR